jgi:dUTP pyrophosphatase
VTTNPTPEQFVAAINGECGPIIFAGINGNIPPAWDVTKVSARLVSRRHVVVTSVVTDKHGMAVDATASVSLPSTYQHVGDILAAQLSENIKHARRGGGGIRISLAPGATVPVRATSGASGYDVRAIEACQIQPGRIVKIRTWLHLEIPSGMEGQIRPRSGWAMRGLWVHVATIDSDYRGECWVIAANLGTDAISVAVGDRVGQLVFSRVDLPELEVVDVGVLSVTDRGACGLGSTGVG